MEQSAGFTGVTLRTAVQDIAGFVFSAIAAATGVAVVAMGVVLVLPQ